MCAPTLFYRLRHGARACALACWFTAAAVSASHADMLRLGTATKTFLSFRVVTVSLYLQEGYKAADVLTDVPKRIDVTYHVSIPRRELGAATLKGIRRNTSAAIFTRLLPRIKQINAYYPDVHSGDQISIMYIPGYGCEVLVNGSSKGVVPGADFARAFFAIWVGDHPVDARARTKLLGR